MKANWFSRVGLVLLMVVWALPCQSDCIPTINSTFNINGIVVGSAIGGGGAPPGTCLPDPGWGGVVALPFVPVSGIPDTHVSRLFVCGRAAGANLDRIYLGLHVENDDGFDFNDIVTFFFDVNNSGTFDTPDFALKIEIGPATPPTDENCNGSFNNLTYYKFVGGVWTQQALPTPTAIIAKTSWDYNGAAPDPESRLWELEVEIRPVDLATTVAVATGLKLGAKLAISEPGIGAMVLAYPMGLTADSSPAAMDPASGDVAAVRLATFDIGTCGPDVVIDSFTAVDTLGAPGKFTTFASAIPGNLPESQRNRFTAHVRFFNPANLADTSPVAVPNNGQVRFRGLPWSMGVGFTADIPLGEPTISFTHLGQIVVPAASWPENETQYSPFRAALAGADHICLKINLNGFNVNQNEPSDLVQQNLTFTRLSTIKESFLIKAARQETPGEKLDYLLRVRWQNLPTEMINPYPDRPKTNLWNFRFLNARQIGLKPIGNGYYRIQLRPSEEKKVEVVLSGGPMPIDTREIKISPQAGGLAVKPPSGRAPVRIKVRPGSMVTVIAEGLITLDQKDPRFRTVTPEGYVDRELWKHRFLMSTNSAYVPFENVGALIGSFDEFKTSFRIGGSASFIVPKRACYLWLAVNDQAGQFTDNTGKGFLATVIMTPPMFLPTRLTAAGNPANGLPVQAQAGINLPRLDIDLINTDCETGTLRPAGYVSYAVYGSHPNY